MQVLASAGSQGLTVKELLEATRHAGEWVGEWISSSSSHTDVYVRDRGFWSQFWYIFNGCTGST